MNASDIGKNMRGPLPNGYDFVATIRPGWLRSISFLFLPGCACWSLAAVMVRLLVAVGSGIRLRHRSLLWADRACQEQVSRFAL